VIAHGLGAARPDRVTDGIHIRQSSQELGGHQRGQRVSKDDGAVRLGIVDDQRNAAEQGVILPGLGEVDFDRLILEEELALAKLLARYPETVESAALTLEPHRIVFYLQELAALFHSYYNRQRVLTEDVEASRARLYLVNCVRIVLENALLLLGVSAPEQM
jgi:hypothetical protein